MNRHSAESLERWTADVLDACGLPAPDAQQAATLLVRSELRGLHTHGLNRLPSYVQRLQQGDFNARPTMTHRSFPGGIVLDADGAMGHVAGPFAVQLAVQALESTASVVVAVQSCGHLGALGVHALLAAEAGLFCLVGQRTPPLLSLEGFEAAAIGHNPIAFACPVPGEAPLVFDVACSVAARGHVLAAARDGHAIPEGWAVDASGRPTTDPQAALEGALLPMGGHKGLGLAMMVECLAGGLAATAASLDPAANEIPKSGAMSRQGAFLWAVRPGAFAADGLFDAYTTHWVDEFHGRGGAAARLPGQRAATLEQQHRAHGIELAPALLNDLRTLGERLGLPLVAGN
jgi:LDH2 family malate/lactate/ureidoglycolate dehydrogenase